jgi:hypothetical protein
MTDEIKGQLQTGQRIALIAVFSTLSVVCDAVAGIPPLIEGVWYGWIFLIAPITGIVLGPYTGFMATLIGVLVGHSLYPRGVVEYLFTLGAPIGSMVTAFIYRKQWKIVILYYSVLFIAYVSSPVASHLPLWGMWDTYVAYGAILLLALTRNMGPHMAAGGRRLRLAACILIGLEADVLFRIFLFIPCQTYASLFNFSVADLHAIWVAGAFITPIQVGLSSVFTAALAPSLLTTLCSLNRVRSETT